MSKEIERTNGYRELSCNLTDAEKIAAGTKLTDLLKEIESKEAELKRISGRYKVEISDLEVKAKYQRDLIETGTEMRDTEITTIKDFVKGEVSVRREDTAEIFELRKMTKEESQKEMPLGDEVKPKKAKKEKPALDVPKTDEPIKDLKDIPDGVVITEPKLQEPASDAPQPVIAPEPDPITDEQIAAAVGHIKATKRASTSSIQRKMRLPYAVACRIMDALEQRGIVGPAEEHGGVREFFPEKYVEPEVPAAQEPEKIPEPF